MVDLWHVDSFLLKSKVDRSINLSCFLCLYNQQRGETGQVTAKKGHQTQAIIRDICAVTLSRFTVEKQPDISSQNIFLHDSLTQYLKILGAGYRKNSSKPVFRQWVPLADFIGVCRQTPWCELSGLSNWLNQRAHLLDAPRLHMA